MNAPLRVYAYTREREMEREREGGGGERGGRERGREREIVIGKVLTKYTHCHTDTMQQRTESHIPL